jgi:endonuclease/exonuclease/phosphatase family metal-dependent hydrolase
MPPFEKPGFQYHYHTQAQINALRDYRDSKPGRQIPPKSPQRLLIATWNIANLGVQERREKDYRLLAEMASWFDLVALQEVNDNLEGLKGLMRHLPASYRAVFSDKAGNNERLVFLYEHPKVQLLEEVGEIAIPPASQRYIRLPGTTQKFRGFDRNPYLAAFRAGHLVVQLVNVHLYFGSATSGAQATRDMNRRALIPYEAGWRRASPRG